MGFFSRNTSKKTAKLKSLIKIAVARLAVVRRPRLGRRSIARSDVGQLLAIGHLDRALLRAEQVIEEDNMLEAIDIIELYCKILVDQAAQLEKPKECSVEIKEAAAGLIFASARCGELPELVDARAILADRFGREFARAAKEGADGVVDPTLVLRLSRERPSSEQQRRLAKEVAAENDILLSFPEDPRGVHQNQQNGQAENVPAEQFVEQSEVKMDRREAQQGRQRVADNDKVDPPTPTPGLAPLSVEEKVSRESKKYVDARMAAEAAFESASFAAMAARAAVELSRTESQGKGPRGGGGSDKVHPVHHRGATEQQARLSSVGSDAAQRGKSVVFDQSDEEGDGVVEDIVWTPQPRRPPYRRTASTMGGGADQRPFQDGVPTDPQHARPPHRRRASELPGGSGLHEALEQRGQYRAPPYTRSPAARADGNGGTARREEGPNGGRPRARQQDGRGGATYESSAYVHPAVGGGELASLIFAPAVGSSLAFGEVPDGGGARFRPARAARRGGSIAAARGGRRRLVEPPHAGPTCCRSAAPAPRCFCQSSSAAGGTAHGAAAAARQGG